ncbi:IS66 family transposase [Clostridium saccharobutylicum]|uniref:Transposase IS66 family protein n=3 Tax=Clostridium saccharobutylicum TaxID=169679 RepID=A0A1S8N5F3_CLOSA|nr:IS66 family transposase [Clostridium saccharobutylicum]OOM06320.1 transposase IS66 family protein [Clostridium saccharobutylicum]OOM06776.1 transposase IS66 family protein [Clostridium saccharobutylicum]OOM11650.1 transposase IS66 family protein [Clostridium saccharobutylicum]OOM16412.1 transposase IS66 family protein [Clostridium saccharobutylicum]
MEILDLEDQLDEKTKLLISKMEKEIESKDKEINNLKKELAFLKGQILNKNRKIFGQSSEQVDSRQLSLFNDAEKNSDFKIDEPTIEEITYTRKKSSSHLGKKDNLTGLDRVIIEHRLNESEAVCDTCGSDLVVIGKKSKEILKYKPAELYIEEHISYTYACKNCEADADKANIVSAKIPNTFLYKSMASNELLAHVVSMKYQYAMPLYRMESYFKMMNVNLSRQTLSNWIISCANELLPVFNYMKEELLKRNYIHADETYVKVIEENGKDSNSKRFMWLYRSGGLEDQVILYDYQKTRSGSCAEEFLKGFSGYLQTDGYDGYNKVKNIKRLYCMAHIRRKFFEIISSLSPEALKQSHALEGFNYCEQLYEIEKELREQYIGSDDYYADRHTMRLKRSAPILKKFQEYVDNEIVNALPKSPLGKALSYAQKLLPYMRTFLTNGCLEIDNNPAERAIKPFVIGRKNWMFSKTTKGAKSSALLYSVIETAKANGLAVEKYLVYLFETLANSEIKERDILEKCMPWSENIPDELRLRTTK